MELAPCRSSAARRPRLHVRGELFGRELDAGPRAVLDGPERLFIGETLGEGGMGTVRHGFQTNLGTSDGAYSGTIVASVTSSDGVSITCDGAAFDTTGDGLEGIPAYLVDQEGNLTRLRVVGNAATAVRSSSRRAPTSLPPSGCRTFWATTRMRSSPRGGSGRG